jgi:hypothetical protein
MLHQWTILGYDLGTRFVYDHYAHYLIGSLSVDMTSPIDADILYSGMGIGIIVHITNVAAMKITLGKHFEGDNATRYSNNSERVIMYSWINDKGEHTIKVKVGDTKKDRFIDYSFLGETRRYSIEQWDAVRKLLV